MMTATTYFGLDADELTRMAEELDVLWRSRQVYHIAADGYAYPPLSLRTLAAIKMLRDQIAEVAPLFEALETMLMSEDECDYDVVQTYQRILNNRKPTNGQSTNGPTGTRGVL